MFRKLRADEVDVRTQSIAKNGKGAILLLYKDARCDMNILDETVGHMNWQRSHSRDNANCTVSIYDKEKGIWVSKEDTGSESNQDAQKGLASDSFKRACFNWGIGRELYTSPFIWVNASDIKGDLKFARYECKSIGYDSNGNINQLEITQDGRVVYSFGRQYKTQPKQQPRNKQQDIATVNKKMQELVSTYQSKEKVYELLKLEEGQFLELYKNEPHKIIELIDKHVKY